MRQRFRKRHPGARHSGTEGMPSSRRRRIIRTMFWSGAALLLLFVVLGYDRSETRQAQEYVEQGRQFEATARYEDAIQVYQRAFENPRLSRAKKGDIAVAIGNIEFERFKDYNSALAWYQRARRVHPQSVERSPVKQRLRDSEQHASARSGRVAPADSETTVPLGIQQVELVSPPESDLRGPVLARFEGGAIRGGELMRALRDLPPGTEQALRNDPARLELFVREQLMKALRYRAALEAGLHRDPTVGSRLYDYQRTLIADRYAATIRERARLIPEEGIRHYYEANQSRYRQPAKVSLSMIKTNSQEAAAAARADLLAGNPFSDVATSHSVDEASGRARGVVGVVTENETEIPGVGPAQQLIPELLKLQRDDVTSVTSANGAWFIFKITSATPRMVTTLEEARPEIVAALRSDQGEELTKELTENLAAQYRAEMDREGLQRFWDYVQNPTEESSATLTAEETTATTSSATAFGSDTVTTPPTLAGGNL